MYVGLEFRREGEAGVSDEVSFSLIPFHKVGSKFLLGKVATSPPVEQNHFHEYERNL